MSKKINSNVSTTSTRCLRCDAPIDDLKAHTQAVSSSWTAAQMYADANKMYICQRS